MRSRRAFRPPQKHDAAGQDSLARAASRWWVSRFFYCAPERQDMIIKRLFQSRFSAAAPALVVGGFVGDAVILGDDPKYDPTSGCYRVPLVGMAGQRLPNKIVLFVAPEGRFAAETPDQDLYNASRNGEGLMTEVAASQGRFTIQSQSLAPGSYDSWVFSVDE